MKNIYYLYILLLSLLPGASFATHIDSTTARQAAINFLQGRVEDSLLAQMTIAPSEQSHLYIFNLPNNNGFILISADNSTKAVLGYSLDGHFEASNTPEIMQWWINGYNRQIAKASELDTASQISNQLYYSNVPLRAPSSVSTVEPLVKALWGQASPYNLDCPNNDTNGQAVAGCVPIAMAEVMHYWKYPKTGTSYKIYDCPNYGTIEVHFDESTYDWANMPDTINDSTSSDIEKEAIAKLVYDCGAASWAQYGNVKQGTGARLFISSDSPYDNAQYGLQSFFGYDSKMTAVARSAYSTNKWKMLLKSELKAGRPILYSGTDSTKTLGHCFVVDGYDANGYFHVNWGWYGHYNGYFSLDSMIPNQWNDYSYNQAALVLLSPPDSALQTNSSSITNDPIATVYPNPTTNEVHITFGGKLSETANLQLTDLNGKDIQHQNTDEDVTLDVSTLTKGVDLLKISQQNKQKTYKLIIK